MGRFPWTMFWSSSAQILRKQKAPWRKYAQPGLFWRPNIWKAKITALEGAK